MFRKQKVEKDCPTQLIRIAKTPFEKLVATEFVAVESKMGEEFAMIKTEIKNLKWLTLAIFVAVVIGRLF